MEEKKHIKISLRRAIILILSGIIIISIIVVLLINKNKYNEELENQSLSDKARYANTEFSFKFLKMENNNKNNIYSPVSIKYALQMLNEGADGNTKKQIENVIGDTKIVKYNNINNILSLANAIYIRDNYSKNIKNEYKNILKNQYKAEVKYDAFKNANNINSWINNETFGQIKNILTDDIVQDPNNEMFLINALAIDMKWEEQFDSKDTYCLPFYLNDGSSMEATTMSKETKSDNASYYKDENVTALAMQLKKYDNKQMEFIALMPNDNLSDYIKNFSIDKFKNITDNLTLASKTKKGLDIFIPRFSFDYELNLQDDLMKMGITDAFDSNLADFSKISSKKPLFVGGALHKANIDFTEKGIKAAAATVIYTETQGMEEIDENRPIEIKIDKPFMYLIRDKKTNEIWFIGTVYEPNLWENDKVNYKYK